MADSSSPSTQIDGESTTKPTGGCHSSTNLNQNEISTNFLITTHKLNGTNFLQWSQSVTLFIKGRGKIGHLNGTTTEPAITDPSYNTWEIENSMVMSWLINSMEPSIGRSYLFLPSARALWDAVKDTYSDVGNSAQLYEVTTKMRDAKQGSKSVTQYFNDLMALWMECDLYYDFEWKCSADHARFLKLIEKDRVFQFLAGLNKDLDEVRGRILGRDPIPTPREVFSEVRREESRRTSCSAPTSPLSSLLPWLPRPLPKPKFEPMTHGNLANLTILSVITVINRGTLGRSVGPYMASPQSYHRARRLPEKVSLWLLQPLHGLLHLPLRFFPLIKFINC